LRKNDRRACVRSPLPRHGIVTVGNAATHEEEEEEEEGEAAVEMREEREEREKGGRGW
jgi:hypothetical protein